MDEKEKAALAEKQAAEAQALAEAEAAKAQEPVIDPKVKELEERLAKVEEEKENYRTVALKRLGKLPGDADFLDADGKSVLTVEEQVKKILLEKEETKLKEERDAENRRILKENAELKLALKNRPSSSIGGGDSGASTVVKDNILSEQQILAAKERAKKLKLDPDKYVESLKVNLSKNTR